MCMEPVGGLSSSGIADNQLYCIVFLPYTLLEKFWQISLYVTYDAFEKFYVTLR